jgi:hypothetical protein
VSFASSIGSASFVPLTMLGETFVVGGASTGAVLSAGVVAGGAFSFPVPRVGIFFCWFLPYARGKAGTIAFGRATAGLDRFCRAFAELLVGAMFAGSATSWRIFLVVFEFTTDVPKIQQ